MNFNIKLYAPIPEVWLVWRIGRGALRNATTSGVLYVSRAHQFCLLQSQRLQQPHFFNY